MRNFIFTRKKKFFAAMIIYQIKIDDIIVATIRNGEKISVSADSGQHKVQCIASIPGESGGYYPLFSDIVYIQNGETDINLLIEPAFASIKLTKQTNN